MDVDYMIKMKKQILHRMRMILPGYSDDFLWEKHQEYLYLVDDINCKYEIIRNAVLRETADIA